MEGIEAVLPAEGKIHIYRIFQEILTNIEKHSQATEVKIEVVRSDHRLTCRIADNGRGLPAEYPERPGGNGGPGIVCHQ